MPKMLRFGSVLVLAFSASWGARVGSAAQDGSRWLISPELLKHAGLNSIWENDLPIRQGERLNQLHVVGERIYAISDRNYMACLDREKGTLVFGRSVAAPGLPVDSPRLFGEKLMSIGGKDLIELDPATGEPRKTTDVGFSIACPAVRNSRFFYLAGPDRRLHVLRVDDKVQIFEVAAENESRITSVVCDEDYVVFATDAGNIISVAADRPKRLWQFNASEGIVGPLVKEAGVLFFAGKDTNVYRIEIVDLPVVRLAWKYQTDGTPDDCPRVTQEVIYQRVHDKGLTAIDKESGRFMWSVPGGVGLLAESSAKAYVFAKPGILVVMDNVTAKKLYAVNFARVSNYVANAEDSSIYIGDERGRLVCLRPSE